MKFTLVVRQVAAVEAGLVGKVTVTDLGFLDYLRGWFFCDGAKIEIREGHKFVWLGYEHAVAELPFIFNPEAKIATRKNQLSALIQKLREAELVETKKIGRRLFFHLTDKALTITKRGKHQAQAAAKKPAAIISPPHDETVTLGRDRTIMSPRDEYLPANIDETGITESEKKETPPLSPYDGEAQSILVFWNSFSELPKAVKLTPNRTRNLRKRLADPWWREHWREGIKRLANSDFAKGGGQRGWQATLGWFLGGDSLAKILEGQYDNRPQPVPKLLPSDIKAQIKAVDELIASHPANDDSDSHCPDASREQREDLKKLRRRRRELVRLLAGVGE